MKRRCGPPPEAVQLIHSTCFYPRSKLTPVPPKDDLVYSWFWKLAALHTTRSPGSIRCQWCWDGQRTLCLVHSNAWLKHGFLRWPPFGNSLWVRPLLTLYSEVCRSEYWASSWSELRRSRQGSHLEESDHCMTFRSSLCLGPPCWLEACTTSASRIVHWQWPCQGITPSILRVHPSWLEQVSPLCPRSFWYWDSWGMSWKTTNWSDHSSS